jgi:hypothetical protein
LTPSNDCRLEELWTSGEGEVRKSRLAEQQDLEIVKWADKDKEAALKHAAQL